MSFAVLGAGSFGTAVANHAARKGHGVVLWCRTDDQARYINEHRRNPRYLKDCPLVESLRATSDLEEALGAGDRTVLAIPTQSLRGFLERLALYFKQCTMILRIWNCLSILQILKRN